MRLSSIAFSSLRRRSSRAAFLVAGLLVGIGTVVTLLTLSSALTMKAQDELETYGANIVVSPRSDSLSLSYGGVTMGGVSFGDDDIPEADLRRIAGIPNRENVAIVAPQLLGTVDVRGRERLLMGVRPDQQFELKKWWSLKGRRPDGAGDVVAGSSVAAALGLRLGDDLRMDGRRFTVVGVLEPTGSPDDNLLVTDLGAAQDVLGKPGRVSMVEVAALCANCPIEDIVDQLGAVLPGTRVTAMQQVVQNRMRALDQFRLFAYVVAGVIIGIEALVVFLTMMGSVNARTREIGVFRALGFRRGHVTELILLEAATASLLAGVLGYLAGMGASYALAPLLADGGAPIAWAPPLAVAAMGLALIIGALGSVYPALHASRLDPTIALRAI